VGDEGVGASVDAAVGRVVGGGAGAPQVMRTRHKMTVSRWAVERFIARY
jgi:hypothetical protein